MGKLIDCDEVYKDMSQWDWQELYLPIHFKQLLEQQPAAQYAYTEQDGEMVVEDVKSPATRKKPEYVLKRKMMLFFHGIRIRET